VFADDARYQRGDGCRRDLDRSLDNQEIHEMPICKISVKRSPIKQYLTVIVFQGRILDHLIERELSDERRRYLEQTLNPSIALRQTAYDDQGKPPCDDDTRVEILADITTWVNDVSSGSRNFFWLTGDPGCGKSAITASIARYCKGAGTLWAQFFINRNNESTTNPRVYFPSIAHQMAMHSPNKAVEKAIYDILKANPCLLDEVTIDQARILFVQIVQVACDLDRGKPVVIVIDGLDETSRKSLKDTATILSRLFKELRRPNAKVFISSRTDDEITKSFYRSLQSNKERVVHLHLNTSDPSCMEDVSKYLSRHLQRLVEERDLNWEVWPGRERFDKLCQRAAGLFIWAVTVMRFFEEQLRLYGHECLDGRLDAISAEGMSDVNKLYQTILAITYTSSPTFVEDGWAHETFRWIVGFIIGLKEPLPIGDVGALLDLRRTSTSNPIDILHFTTNLRTVLVAGTGEITRDTIPRLHKSFVEFITSKKADEQFRIYSDIVDVEIGLKCLRLVSRLRNNVGRSSTPPACVRYAIQNWTRHLPNNGIASGVAIFGDSHQFHSRIHGAALGAVSVSGDYRTHMYDPAQGCPPPAPFHFSHSSTIEVGDRVNSVAISMDGRLIASGSHTGAIQLWDSKSHMPFGGPLQGHSAWMNSVSFSPDSRWLVSGSDDKMIRVWDCKTGQAVGDPLFGHIDFVWSVCTDGRFIVSGSRDKTIRIWDLATRTQIGWPINTGEGVDAVALSNDGRVAAEVRNSICVWDVNSHRRIAVMKGHKSFVSAIAFSPDNRRIASGSDDNIIRLWDTETYTQIGEFTGHTDAVHSVSFSPDGRLIASGSSDKTVRIWHCDACQPIVSTLQGHTDRISSIAVSSDGYQLISGSWDGTVRIWSKSTSGEWPHLSQQITTIYLSQHNDPPPHMKSLGGNPSVVSACYSPDRTLYAASTLDGQVSLWHIKDGLLWESDTPIHPIHHLRLSADRLVISSPDGSVWTWELVEGKPTQQTPATSGPQLNTTKIHDLRLRGGLPTDNSAVQWIPFKVDAGLWAYLDGAFIRFEGVGGGSMTFIDFGR